MFNSLWPCGLSSPWNSPGQNTGVGSLSLLQGIFPTQGLNPGLPHCRRILYQLSHRGSSLLQFADIFVFYKLKVCGNTDWSKSISRIFPTAFAHFGSLCHILVIFTIFQFIINSHIHYDYICYGDPWLVIFNITIAKRLWIIGGPDDD